MLGFLNWWVDITVDELKVGKIESNEMEQPESPHDWIADEVLDVPKSEHLDHCLLEVRHPLKYLHVLKPGGLDKISTEPVLWNVPADINVEAVLKQESHEDWSQQNFYLVDNTLLNVLERTFKWNAFKGCRHFYQK